MYDPTKILGEDNERRPEVYGPDIGIGRAASNRIRRTTKQGKEESRGTAVNMSIASEKEI